MINAFRQYAMHGIGLMVEYDNYDNLYIIHLDPYLNEEDCTIGSELHCFAKEPEEVEIAAMSLLNEYLSTRIY